MTLTDEQLKELFKKTWESMPDAARSAPEPPPMAVAYGRAVADAMQHDTNKLRTVLNGLLDLCVYADLEWNILDRAEQVLKETL